MLAGTPARAPATQAAPLSAGKALPWASKGGSMKRAPRRHLRACGGQGRLSSGRARRWGGGCSCQAWEMQGDEALPQKLN